MGISRKPICLQWHTYKNDHDHTYHNEYNRRYGRNTPCPVRGPIRVPGRGFSCACSKHEVQKRETPKVAQSMRLANYTLDATNLSREACEGSFFSHVARILVYFNRRQLQGPKGIYKRHLPK